MANSTITTPPPAITLLNFNANGIKTQKSLIMSFLARYKVDLVCITETHLVQAENFKINGYEVIRQDRSARTASGGVAIFIKNKYLHSTITIDNVSSMEVVGVQIQLANNKKLRIITAYKQPNKTLLEKDMINLFDSSIPTMVIGDLNSKSTTWGCRTNNPNGNKLVQIASNLRLNISAPEEYTYFPYRVDHQPDILDIIVSKNISWPINQSVISELDSDHLPIIITMNNIIIPTLSIPRLINGKIDWRLFQIYLNGTLSAPKLTNCKEIDKYVENLTNTVKEAAKNSTKEYRKRPKINYNMPPLFIIKLIEEKSRIRRKWQRIRDPQIKSRLNNLTHKIRNLLDQHRIETYNRTISTIEPNDPGLWKATKYITKRPTIIPPIKGNGCTYETDDEKCKMFAENLEKTFSPSLQDEARLRMGPIINFNETHLPNTQDFDQPVTPSEIRGYINGLCIRKAPGFDLMPNILLKNLPKKSVVFLTGLFNACFRLGYFPDAWKHAHILMVPKQGQNHSDCTSYRPISLLSTLSKLFEKCISVRLKAFLNSKNIIPATQFGFRKNHSAVHQLLRVTEIIERGFEAKQYTTIAFLDISKAFDKVWINGLKYKLLKINTPSYISAVLFSFLLDRSFAVRINGSLSETKCIRAGVPQGSLLGPTLYTIFTYDIPHLQINSIATFADDTAIITQHKHLNQSAHLLQESLNKIGKWIKEWGLNINESKCQLKIFTLRRIPRTKNLEINNREIPWLHKDQPAKYLGLYFDTRLTWSYHINNKLNQGYARLKQLYHLINRNTPLKLECVLLLYKSLLRSLLTYACPVWCATSKTNINKLQVFQNKLLRIAVNAPWFVRNEQIHMELQTETIAEFVKRQSTNFFNSLDLCSSAQSLQLGHRNIHRRLKRKLPQDII